MVGGNGYLPESSLSTNVRTTRRWRLAEPSRPQAAGPIGWLLTRELLSTSIEPMLGTARAIEPGPSGALDLVATTASWLGLTYTPRGVGRQGRRDMSNVPIEPPHSHHRKMTKPRAELKNELHLWGGRPK